MNRKDPETSEWIDRAQNGDKLFSYINVNAVHIISFVRDSDGHIQGEIRDKGEAFWRVINESTTRKRRMTLRAKARSGKAVWERAPTHSPCPGEIDIHVEVARSDGQDYSEDFIATSEGEEAIVTRCQKYSNVLRSGFTIRRATHPQSGRNSTIRIFVSYSHQDSEYLGKRSLLGFLSGLEQEGFEFWYDNSDKGIRAGELWDEKIKEEMDRADVALVLVSQWFLNSQYCKNVEIRRFLELQRERGLIIFPVILSPCEWYQHKWLSATQFEPREGKSIAGDYNDEGMKCGLYLRILQQLRILGEGIRKKRERE